MDTSCEIPHIPNKQEVEWNEKLRSQLSWIQQSPERWHLVCVTLEKFHYTALDYKIYTQVSLSQWETTLKCISIGKSVHSHEHHYWEIWSDDDILTWLTVRASPRGRWVFSDTLLYDLVLVLISFAYADADLSLCVAAVTWRSESLVGFGCVSDAEVQCG